MCRFLLSKHADVDVYYREDDKPGYNGHDRLVPILGSAYGSFLIPPESGDTLRRQECCKLLIEAGADPMDATDFAELTPFFNAFSSGNSVSKQESLDHISKSFRAPY